jgi:muramoyltetrapeptide carboxypeptidase
LVAAAGPVTREPFLAGVAILGRRYELVYDERIFTRTGYLAGDDATRRAELFGALRDPTTRAVWCARGGYGIMRLLDEALITELRNHPKAIIGFSDVTALHAACARAELQSVHGPSVTQISTLLEHEVAALYQLLECEVPAPPLTGLRRVVAGRAEGRLAGGNLELVSRLCGTPFALDLADKILLLEEVGERPYRIDRALTQLRLAGALNRVAGVVLGEFIRCKDPDGIGPTADEVAIERLADLGIPVVADAPVGHGTKNRALPLGARATLDAGAGVLELHDPAVGPAAEPVVGAATQ